MPNCQYKIACCLGEGDGGQVDHCEDKETTGADRNWYQKY